MNRFTVSIKQAGEWHEVTTPVFPFSWGELLDERLDEAYVTVYSRVEQYNRLDRVRVTIHNGNKVRDEYFAIASDSATESPVGSGRYKHDLYLIELMKLTEGIICSSITFTNAKGKEYVGKGLAVITDLADVNLTYQPLSEYLNDTSIKALVSPVSASDTYYVPTAKTVAEEIARRITEDGTLPGIDLTAVEKSENGAYYTEMRRKNDTKVYKWDDQIVLDPPAAVDVFEYQCCIEGLSAFNLVFKFEARVLARDNRLPLKRWTITEAISRVCELALPLLGTAEPIYKLDGVKYNGDGKVIKPYPTGSLAEKYDKIFAPEVTLTQDTLREQLKVLFSYVHAEPWIDENNVIFCTEYGGEVEADTSGLPCVFSTTASHINEYCTEIRSNVQNLASSLGYAKGVIVDPGKGLYRSLRTDTVYARINEENGIARTEKPIYEIEQVMCGIPSLDGTGWAVGPADITPYVLEATEYSANTSSYVAQYPDSKEYAIYYTQGAPNLNGLFYKAPRAGSTAAKSNFAISNILSIATGKSAKDIDKFLTDFIGTAASIMFSITYKPISNHFVSHGKQLYVADEHRYMQVYNQGENLVESRYFGENIKGVAARLGNVEKERTFILHDIDHVPRVGQMLDGYAITTVSCELYPFDIKCTVGLSKDFNRISEHVGINSHKRMYEISERQATQRDILLKETLVIGKKPAYHYQSEKIFSDITPVSTAFTGDNNGRYHVSAAMFLASGRNGHPISDNVLLPVICRPLGNTVNFNFSMKDNYSAGSGSRHLIDDSTPGQTIEGRWEVDTPYTDYYGRAYFADEALYGGNLAAGLTDEEVVTYGFEAPLDTVLSVKGRQPLLKLPKKHRLRKDNREVLSYNIELEIKTESPDIIIGSALAELVGWVSDTDIYPELYYFDTTEQHISKFDKIFTPRAGNTYGGAYDEKLGWSLVPNVDSTFTITIKGQPHHDGWVICTPINTVTETVNNEDGEVEVVSYQTGGEILLASNKRIPYGDTLSLDFYVTT